MMLHKAKLSILVTLIIDLMVIANGATTSER